MNYKQAVGFFGRIGIKHLSSYFFPLKEVIITSNLNILFDVYVGKMLFFSALSFAVAWLGMSLFLAIMGMDIFLSIVGAFIIGAIASFVVLIIFHSYPFQLIRTRKLSIEANMAFAVNHMAAIASSGVPPYIIFKLVSIIKEYGEMSRECMRVVRNIDVFGMDVTAAVKNVAKRTPSPELRKFFHGMVSTIETGGNLQRYLDSASKDAIFDYRLKRESYLQTLSTYADIYTAVLIAAPLFFVSVLSIMALVGGQVFGFNIPVILRIGIFGLVPIMNIAFLAFIHYTQPSV